MSTALAQTGIASWNIEYRRLGNPGGGWPGSYEDLGDAADFLSTIAAGKHLDLTKVIVIWHSSGGQLAMWLAARRRLPASSPLYKPSPLPISGAVDIDGPPDMSVASTWDQMACGAPVVEQFLGGSATDVPSRYIEGSAAALLPLGVRQELIYSDHTEFMARDEQKWAQLFTSYAAKATASGDSVHICRLEKAGHFNGLDPHSASWPAVIAKVRSLL